MTLHDYDFWIPALIWLRARHPGKRMKPVTHREIAERSGMPIGRVRWLSAKLDWAGCDLPTIKAWMNGCFFDPGKQFREREFLKRSVIQAGCPMPHLRSLPEREFRLAKRMLTLIIKKP